MSVGNYYAFYLFIVLFLVLIVYTHNFRKVIPFFKTLSFMYVNNAYIKNYYIKKIFMIFFYIKSRFFDYCYLRYFLGTKSY